MKNDTYLVMVDKNYARNIELFTGDNIYDGDIYDDSKWIATDRDVVMGTVLAQSAGEAILIVAERENIIKDAFSAVQIPSDFEVGTSY